MISVIVPVYNVQLFLQKCIDSILAQSYEQFELILVDDGSSDSSGEICDCYAKKDERIRVIHQKNAGLSAARNVGIDFSSGEAICFIDADDFIAKNMLEIMWHTMVSEKADLVICGVQLVDDKGQTMDAFFEVDGDGTQTGKEQYLSLCSDNLTTYEVAWNKLYASFLWKTRRYPIGRIHEDIFVAHEILFEARKVAKVKEYCYFYRQREGSIINSPTVQSKKDRVDGYYLRLMFFIQTKAPYQSIHFVANVFWLFAKEYCYAVFSQKDVCLHQDIMTVLKKVRASMFYIVSLKDSIPILVTKLLFAFSPKLTFTIARQMKRRETK